MFLDKIDKLQPLPNIYLTAFDIDLKVTLEIAISFRPSKTYKRTDVLRGIFDYDNKSERLIEVERELAEPSVWDDQTVPKSWEKSDQA